MLVHDFLHHSADRSGEKTALVYGSKRVSYRGLSGYARKIAGWLIQEGLNKGDRVALLTDEPKDYISSYFGILQAGGIAVALNTQTSERSLDGVLRDCLPSFFLLSGRSRKYANFITSHPMGIRVQNISALLEEDQEGSTFPSTLPSITEKDIAQIMYTSGTTGKAKGVMLSHLNLTANTESIIDYLSLTANDTVMAVLPFFYSYGNSVLLSHIAASATLVVNQSFVYPNLILDQMVAEEVTGLSGVPSTFAILLHRSALRDYSFPHLRYLTQAGAAMTPTMANQLSEVFDDCDIYIMYGQTEAAPRLSYLAPEYLLRKPGSIGKAIPGVTLDIVRKDGTTALPGETGEIVAQGDNIMAGYWQRPEETEKVLREGKLWTGDLAFRDEDGFFFIVSRKSDMIKCGSHRIAPQEIEEILCEIDEVSEAAVVGRQDAILGESLHGYVVFKPNSSLPVKEIIRYCKKNLPPFKIPQLISVVEKLPKSKSGKIRRRDLTLE